MSREERRQQRRMMRSMERGPALPPAARARAERNRARREARGPATHGFTRRFWLVTLAIAFGAGLLAFSVQWPNMPFAMYAGLAVGLAALAVQVVIRLILRRAAGR